MDFLLHTDFGHDPDDAIALAYLIEHGYVPNRISISPGAAEQKQALTGFLDLYRETHWLSGDVDLCCNIIDPKDVNVGKHRLFFNGARRVFFPLPEPLCADKALIIGPAKGYENLECEELFFQGGYSPNSIKPLEKFAGKQAVQSFNPNGTGKDFMKIVNSTKIDRKYFVGKNVCHGFTKHDLQQLWEPTNLVVLKFWNQLQECKAMHDVLAAMMFINKDLGIWEQAKPVKTKEGYTTEPTSQEIYTLIGVKI